MSYCSYCGAKLVEDARFCSNCGKPVVQQNADSPISQALPDTGKDTSRTLQPSKPPYIVKFLDREIKFDHSFEKYNEFRKKGMSRIDADKEKFETYYKQNVNNFDTLWDNGLEFLLTQAKVFVKFCVYTAHDYGATGVDEDMYFQIADNASFFCSTLQYYSEMASQLTDLAEKITSYRAAQSVARPRWQGGGFTITGAIQGAITAGALNLGTDMVRGIGNSITNASDRAKLKKLEDELYQREDHMRRLLNALDSWDMAMWRATESLLRSDNLLEVQHFDSGIALDYISKAEEIVRNATEDTPVTEYDRAIDLICKGLPYDPYNFVQAYTTLYKIPQVCTGDLVAIAKFFGVEKEFDIKRDEINQDRLSPILNMPENTISNIDRKIESLKLLHDNYDDIDVAAYISSCGQKRNSLIEQESTQKAKAESQERLKVRFARAKELHDKYYILARGNDLEGVWKMAENGVAYAQYRLEIELHPNYDITCRVEHKEAYQRHLESGSLFAKYLQAWFPYDIEVRHWTTGKQLSENCKKSTEIIYSLAQQGVISAMGRCGVWGTKDRWDGKHGNPYVHWSEAEAIEYLKKAAEADDRTSLWALASFYRKGIYGFPQNELLAQEYNSIPEYYNKLVPPKSPASSSSSSGCFITSAVCRTFGKPDDCYELTKFRSFRDKWLSIQPDGPALIQEYYQVAPEIVRQIDRQDNSAEIYNSIWNEYLAPCLQFIQNGHLAECKNAYVSMVNKLRARYITTVVC